MTDQINELREELTKIKSQPKREETPHPHKKEETPRPPEKEEKPKPKNIQVEVIETPEESFKTMMKPVPTEESQKKPEPKIPQMTTYSVKGRRKRGYY